ATGAVGAEHWPAAGPSAGALACAMRALAWGMPCSIALAPARNALAMCSTQKPHPMRSPPVSHEPRIQELHDALERVGHHPFPLPLGMLLDEKDGRPLHTSACVRCDAFDGYPCLVNGKADAQIICVEPVLKHANVTLVTNAFVERLETEPTGRSVSAVHVDHEGTKEAYSADIVVVACGALNSALLLLRSACDKHPDGLANSSGVVGRHYMRHNNMAFMAISHEPNQTKFQKTLALNDFYFGAPD